MKLCRECSIDLGTDNRVPGKNLCKPCKRIYNDIYYSTNRDRLVVQMRQYYQNNAEQFSAYNKQYKEDNRDKLRKYMTDYQRKRRSTDPQYRLMHNLRRLIKISLARQGYTQTSKAFEILGADFDTVHNHLSKTAVSNYGKYFPRRKYHVDHVIPCSFAKTEEDLIKLQHYTNLQLLYPKDNLIKGAKLPVVVK